MAQVTKSNLIFARAIFYTQCVFAIILVYAVRADSFRLDKENWPNILPEVVTTLALLGGQFLSFVAPIFLVYQTRSSKDDFFLTVTIAGSVVLSVTIWAAVITLFA